MAELGLKGLGIIRLFFARGVDFDVTAEVSGMYTAALRRYRRVADDTRTRPLAAEGARARSRRGPVSLADEAAPRRPGTKMTRSILQPSCPLHDFQC